MRSAPLQLSLDLRAELFWLASNWKKKGLSGLSPYNTLFYNSLLTILSGNANSEDVEIVIAGTLGRVADGYAHLLDVDPDELAKDPWIALRRLGEISAKLKNSLM